MNLNYLYIFSTAQYRYGIDDFRLKFTIWHSWATVPTSCHSFLSNATSAEHKCFSTFCSQCSAAGAAKCTFIIDEAESFHRHCYQSS